jgi:hypothetical protein
VKCTAFLHILNRLYILTILFEGDRVTEKNAILAPTWLIFLNLLFINICTTTVHAQQDEVILEAKGSLQSWLTWVKSYVGEDGQVTSGFRAQNTIRGTALLGQLVIGIHMDIIDSPSLLLLNRIANYLNTKIPQEILTDNSRL